MQRIPVRFGTHVAAVRAVAFDKDGTLLESAPFLQAVWQHRRALLAEIIAAGLTDAGHSDGAAVAALAVVEWERTIGAVDGVFDRRGPFWVGPVEENQLLMAGVVYHYLGWHWERCREIAWEIYHAANRRIDFHQVVQPRPGVVAMVRSLQQAGVAVGIVTSDHAERAHQTLDVIGLPAATWDFVLTPADVVRPKPAPDMVYEVCRRLGCAPADVAVVGDSAVDVQMARAAGALGVSVPEEAADAAFLASLADVVLKGPHEIAPA